MNATKRTAISLAALLMMLLLGALPSAPPARSAAPTGADVLPAWFAPPTPKIEPALQEALDSAAPDDPLRVIVTLRTPDAPSLPAASAARDATSRIAHRAALVQARQATFEQAIAPLTPLLESASARGELVAQRDLWIIHGVALTARPALIQQLATSPAVESLSGDHYHTYIEPPPFADGAETFRLEETPPWGIEKIRAPEVHSSLGVTGAGAVIAIMDTGAEFRHPALQANYRGNVGHDLFHHAASWFDPINDGVYPYDDHGHGTHVAGTAAGQAPLGVAPGAQWIGVKILNGDGAGYTSWIHAGFQWLLAPDGDPANAPDVVNCSWSSRLSYDQTFQEDIDMLQAAGILPVFAAGNSGPGAHSVGSPASLPGVLAVGASDPDDEMAYFSSRGPSPWGQKKPTIVAPGVNVNSSVVGGIHQEYNGTSMATPHVVGVIGLMRSVSPTLSITEATHILTRTAIPLGATIPNNDSGWGRIDAFAALVEVAALGRITGTVRDARTGAALRDATIQATPQGEPGNPATATTQINGRYLLALRPGLYDLTISAFGYNLQRRWHLPAREGEDQRLDFTLRPLAEGDLWGRVTVAPGQKTPPQTITLRLRGTPLTTTTDADGDYRFSPPAGKYTLEARPLGYQVASADVSIQAEALTEQDLTLTPIPKLLLMDDGAWHYGSRISRWRETLDSLGYTYDEERIKSPGVDVPASGTLAAYDVVLWSSPRGSPGLAGAGSVLRTYLAQGGRLFLSGPNVAYYDGGGRLGHQAYLYDQMGVDFTADDAESDQLHALAPLAPLTITLAGDEATSPDAVTLSDPHVADLMWEYETGAGGGTGAHICAPYRAAFLSFGYETISNLQSRRAVITRTLDWLLQPPATSGLELMVTTPITVIGMPGETLTHTFHLRHTGYAGSQEIANLSLKGNRWQSQLRPTSLPIQPCEWQTVTLHVTIPPTAGIHDIDTVTLTAIAAPSGEQISRRITTKTPAPVLLVDDDRWYQMEDAYLGPLASRDIPFDRWDTAHSIGGLVGATSPTTETLTRYPIIVWFTGYDWYSPILPQEAEHLLAYLDQGGRLLLSSQDFLYHHGGSALARRFGYKFWYEGQQAEGAQGVPDHPAGGTWGPVALDFPFQNWSDVIEPQPGIAPLMRGDAGQPLGLAAGETTPGAWRTVFYAMPLETLPDDARAEGLANGVAWLSPLGQSTWQVTPTAPASDERLHYILALRNDAKEAQEVHVSHVHAPDIQLENWPPAMRYQPEARELTWEGALAPGAPITFTWEGQLATQAGDHLTPTVRITMRDMKLDFTRTAHLHISGADLSASGWLSPAGSTLVVNHPTTLTFALRNDGAGPATRASVRSWATDGTTRTITSSIPFDYYYTRQGWSELLWEGEIAPGSTRLLTLPLRAYESDRQIRVDALIEDGAGQRWEVRQWWEVAPWEVYLPVVVRME